MTGIERLREFVAGISPVIAVCGVTKTSYDREHMEEAGACLRDFLADIADQIERERACDSDTAENIRLIVGRVIDEMERHVSGVEGAEDSPVARWARELREALGATVSRRESDGVADSPYDALRPDDRDAIAWVREHGGLDSVKELLGWVVGHCSTRQQLDFDFWLSGRVMHELGFEEDMADRDEVERRLLARLMPDGMEWPTVDGEPVVIGERLVGYGSDDDGYEVVGVRPTCGWVLVKSYDHIHRDGGPVILEWDASKCHRPAPKVLDADGVEIRVGDEVYQMGCKYRVSHLRGANGKVRIVYENSGRWVDPKTLTHRAPVLAADGKPLREGQTVWDENGDELVIVALEDGGQTVTCRYVDVGDAIPVHGMWSPSGLTHERPDSWERLEEDARSCTCVMEAIGLVRRCRALAERERGK